MYSIQAYYVNYNDQEEFDFVTLQDSVILFNSKDKAQEFVTILNMMSEYIDDLEEAIGENESCFPLKFRKLCDPFPSKSRFFVEEFNSVVLD